MRAALQNFLLVWLRFILECVGRCLEVLCVNMCVISNFILVLVRLLWLNALLLDALKTLGICVAWFHSWELLCLLVIVLNDDCVFIRFLAHVVRCTLLPSHFCPSVCHTGDWCVNDSVYQNILCTTDLLQNPIKNEHYELFMATKLNECPIKIHFF